MSYGDVSFTMATPFARLGYTILRPVMWLAVGNREFAPLQRITTLHFATFAVANNVYQRLGSRSGLKAPYLIFFSLFDGAADAYLADFSVLVPDYIDSLWGKCIGYPGSRDFPRFMHWLGQHALTRAKPETPQGATRYEYHGYRVDPVSGGPATEESARRLAPMPLIAKAMELRRRLLDMRKELETMSVGKRKKALQNLAIDML